MKTKILAIPKHHPIIFPGKIDLFAQEI